MALAPATQIAAESGVPIFQLRLIDLWHPGQTQEAMTHGARARLAAPGRGATREGVERAERKERKEGKATHFHRGNGEVSGGFLVFPRAAVLLYWEEGRVHRDKANGCCRAHSLLLK